MSAAIDVLIWCNTVTALPTDGAACCGTVSPEHVDGDRLSFSTSDRLKMIARIFHLTCDALTFSNIASILSSHHVFNVYCHQLS